MVGPRVGSRVGSEGWLNVVAQGFAQRAGLRICSRVDSGVCSMSSFKGLAQELVQSWLEGWF